MQLITQVKPNLNTRFIIKQLNNTLRTILTEEEIDALECDVDIDTEINYVWTMYLEDYRHRLVYHKSTGNIYYEKREELI